MDLGLTDARALVVGGSRGMGLATVRSLSAEGCRVAIIGRGQADVDAAAQLATEAGSPAVLPLVADATSTSAITEAIEAVSREWAALNILIFAVGPAGAGRIEELDDERWSVALDTGALSAVRVVRAALPLLRAADWARIVTITAMSIQHQSPYLVSYTAAKSALLSLTKNLARSLAPDGILVNAVAPGPILSDWVSSALSGSSVDATDPAAAFAALKDSHGVSADLGRMGLADEVAAVVTFCASRRNGFMTGAHLNVDGGSDFV
ncbi:MAG TPA: SDR family oxidoreductase [Mycobacteriales bacterium]|jgi:NAD(P)-dependent dehydrogenase (short-subunit alcohol dehydrogenase family)|nr:SDR family oxidoreductase [Mycobacteriales bacterium]HVV77733.1 SDR family oxidoreductase [Mycobacteriales bacterium]HVY11661.1 SDR family oxidoreductase [Mycobacteriales bacterium]HWA67907.1 SDR family oxidoreductase [Mycobacteriales bacterium]